MDDLVQQLFAVAASDGIVGVGGRGADKDIDKRGGFWYSTKVPCANDTRWCGAMAAQLICNQWVAGSTPVTSSKKSYDIPLKSGVYRGAFAFWERYAGLFNKEKKCYNTYKPETLHERMGVL